MPIKICVFDAYGTLFDVSAAARLAADEPGFEALADHWPQIAEIWRRKQLQYTWIRAITDVHADFWHVTQDALDWALAASGLDGDDRLRNRLLDLYLDLTAYSEVPDMLAELRAAGMRTAILSNGSPTMLERAVGAAGIGSLLDAVISVESVGVFKPHASVYELVRKRFLCETDAVLFVSSNGWDAAAATGFGFHTVWVNRADEPIDRLPWTPHHLATDLSIIPSLVA